MFSIYLIILLAGLQAGALTVMVNSASVNGMPMHANKDIGQLLLSIQKAFDVLVEKRTDFEAKGSASSSGPR